jgi:hypothetical protein
MRLTTRSAATVLLSALLLVASPAGAQGAKKASAPGPQPPEEERAGSVTAEIPRGQIARLAETLPAEVNADIFWNDIVQTAQRGRVRITLLDTSILNIGPQATFRVVAHDEKTGQSELYLMTGQMRARVKKGSGDKQKFTVRTDAAVLGVIGTDFFVGAKSDETTVTVYEGSVRVRSSDPDVTGETRVNAGETLTVKKGEPPPPAMPATLQQLEESLRDTDVGPALPPPQVLQTLRQAAASTPPSASPAQSATSEAPTQAAPAAAETWKSGWGIYSSGFSADQVITQGSQRYMMKVYMRQNGFRMEMEQQGQRMIMITRPDRNVVWTVLPDQQMYMEFPIGGGMMGRQMPGQGGFAEAMRESGADSEIEMLGFEQVSGYRCQKFRFRTRNKGETHSGLVWSALALNGFPIKMMEEKTGTVVEYQNIRIGPPDASLFEVPPGYRKMSF